MLKHEINVIGQNYRMEDMMIDLVEQCYGFAIIDNDGFMYQYTEGDKYRDGEIVNCFVHHESGTVFMVVECDCVYFEIGFDNVDRYDLLQDELPFR